MKKKWIIICSISILISAAIFADTEFDVYYYGVPVTDTYTAVNKDKFAHKSALGIGNDLGFYFVNFPHADIGIACNYGAEFFRTAEVPFISKIISSQFAVFDWAVCAFVNAAPVVRFTVNYRFAGDTISSAFCRKVGKRRNGYARMADGRIFTRRVSVVGVEQNELPSRTFDRCIYFRSCRSCLCGGNNTRRYKGFFR